jgi:DNA repair photolyase
VIVTKNHLVTRDIDILSDLARYDCVGVTLSLTTLDHKLSSLMEPRASRPARRLEAIRRLAEAGVPAGYLQAPMIPGLTDSEAPAIAVAAAKTMARSALPGQEKQDSQPSSRNPRRQTERRQF